MKHARAWVKGQYPGALVIEAKPRIAWIPTKKGRIPRSISEDIFGCFDLMVMPAATLSGISTRRAFSSNDPTWTNTKLTHLLQITTLGVGRGAATTRMSKIALWIHEALADENPHWLGTIKVMGWVPRKHFRVWEWSWEPLDAHRPMGWKEGVPVRAPLPRKTQSAA